MSECKCYEYRMPKGKQGDYLVSCKQCRIWIEIKIPRHIPYAQFYNYAKTVAKRINGVGEVTIGECIEPVYFEHLIEL